MSWEEISDKSIILKPYLKLTECLKCKTKWYCFNFFLKTWLWKQESQLIFSVSLRDFKRYNQHQWSDVFQLTGDVLWISVVEIHEVFFTLQLLETTSSIALVCCCSFSFCLKAGFGFKPESIRIMRLFKHYKYVFLLPLHELDGNLGPSMIILKPALRLYDTVSPESTIIFKRNAKWSVVIIQLWN